MYISNVAIKNFRLLQDVSFSFEKETTVIVGRNNSGKTSVVELFRKMLQGNATFKLEDFNSNSIENFRTAIRTKASGASWDTISDSIPQIELRFSIDYSENSDDFGFLGNFLIELKEEVTENIISLTYSISPTRRDDFFKDSPEDLDSAEFCKWLSIAIPTNFQTFAFIIDPTDGDNTQVVTLQELKKLIHVDIISAQRGLDDNTEKERDILGQTLSNIFKYSSYDTAPQEMQNKVKELENIFKNIQKILDDDIKHHVDTLLPTMNFFGFPRLDDPKLSTETTIELGNLLTGNTRIKYDCTNTLSLPETYNGLGTRNLIYILFELWGCFKKFQTTMNPSAIHIIFIEEPEAHLHPQMQEIFIRHLSEMIKKFHEDLSTNECWNVQFLVSTHSSHIANEAEFKGIRYFTSRNNFSTVKDLNEYFSNPETQEDIQFIHKYMSLTKCDLFFADKAILVEGITERLLLPYFIKTSSPVLCNQYISIVEIGGAHAHHFYKFLDFINLPTLIITDLDSVKRSGQTYQKCLVSEGVRSSNTALNKWAELRQKVPASFSRSILLLTIRRMQKISKNLRITFQIPEELDDPCGRSFEDAFMLANKEHFFAGQTENLDNLAFEAAAKKKDCKADFALEIALSNNNWATPAYITEGLDWLANMDNVWNNCNAN